MGRKRAKVGSAEVIIATIQIIRACGWPTPTPSSPAPLHHSTRDFATRNYVKLRISCCFFFLYTYHFRFCTFLCQCLYDPHSLAFSSVSLGQIVALVKCLQCCRRNGNVLHQELCHIKLSFIFGYVYSNN